MNVNLSQLHAAPGSRQRRRRVGRGHGSGRGKTAGRGTKGQKARSGGQIPAYFEGGQNPLVHRMPVKRGLHFRSNPNKVRPVAINLRELAQFPAGQTVDLAALIAARLVSKNTRRLKILGEGELTHPLTVVAHEFSGSARAKIEAAGGQAVVVQPPTSQEQ